MVSFTSPFVLRMELESGLIWSWQHVIPGWRLIKESQRRMTVTGDVGDCHQVD
jgi:hypothetical protein